MGDRRQHCILHSHPGLATQLWHERIEDDAAAASLIDAVSNLGAAYATKEESLHNNNASINAMQGQI